MAEAPKIFGLIPLVMNDVGAIGKDGVNEFDNYKFRSIDDVYNKLQPVLAKHKVFFVPNVIESSEERFQTDKGKSQVRVKLRVKYQIFADDGSSIEATVDGEAVDRSDKATNKALTAAFKYLLIQVFCIAVKGLDDADADAESPELTFVPEKKSAPEPTEKKAPPNLAPKSKDMKIPDGKFKGKMLSKVPAAELKEYIESILQAMEASGRKPPKWFEELRKVSGL